MRFYKYHALGNDYIVMNPSDYPTWNEPSAEQIRLICHRNFGAGSDGILWGPLPSAHAEGGRLRIFNPDASEAEKSGNGLRIFSRYLWDHKLVNQPHFKIETAGGLVESRILEGGRQVCVDMGQVSFAGDRIPVLGGAREVINETLSVQGRSFAFCAASIGNPHCVIPLPSVSSALAKRYGPDIEVLPIFPRKTNVQFLEVLDRSNIRIEIWERGAGYTLASGSSSSAAAAVARKLGLVERQVSVHMPGGTIAIEIGDDYSIRMTGSVTRVGEGLLDPELFETRLS